MPSSMSSEPHIILVDITKTPPARLDKALALFAPATAQLSRSQIARLIAQGCVALEGQIITEPRTKPALGQIWQITLPPAKDYDTAAQNIPLDVVYEDEAVIVINKPAGMVVHPAPGSPDGTLVNALLYHCQDSLSGIGGEKRPGIVHRIDKDTSGLLVAAKSDRAHLGLAQQFEKHSVERQYQALVYGVPEASDPRLNGLPGVAFEKGNILRIIANLARHKTDRQRQAVVKGAGRHAITRARVQKTFGAPPVLSLLECWLETGRTHQIRVHMAHVGHALVGDPLYGRARKLPKGSLSPQGEAALRAFPRQALHAATLGFEHPISNAPMRFTAPMPEDFQTLLDAQS